MDFELPKTKDEVEEEKKSTEAIKEDPKEVVEEEPIEEENVFEETSFSDEKEKVVEETKIEEIEEP